MSVRTLLQERQELLTEMQKLVATAQDEHREMTTKEDKRWNHLDQLVGHLKEQIKASQIEEEQERDPNTPATRISAIGSAPFRHWEKSEGWRDTRTGKEVRVLNPNQKVATERSQYGLGDYLKAIVFGTKDAELRTVLSEGASGGAYLTNPVLSAQIIDLLRSKSVAFAAGAKTAVMDSPTVYLARLTTDAPTQWHTESASDLLQNSPIFDRVTLTAKTLGTVFKVSRELLEDAANLNEVVSRSVAAAFALAVDASVFTGTGTTVPLGLANLGVTGFSGGVIGDYNSLLIGIRTLLAANAAMPTAMVMSPAVLMRYASLFTGISGDKSPLEKPDILANIPFLQTTSITDTGSPPQSKVYIGDFSECLIGMRTEFNIRLLNELYAASGEVGFYGWLRCDVAFLHTASFCIDTVTL